MIKLLKKKYPPFTVIMRGYRFAEADAICAAMTDYGEHFAVEVTLNTEGAYDIIRHLSTTYGSKVKIGAGTVRSLTEAQKAVAAGATFLLGPHVFTKEILDYCQEQNILSVPSGMTPSEISEMFQLGADIVKVFPAAVVGPRFFKDVQAPLGTLPLMAVGGVNSENVKDFFASGASFVGMGSGMFTKESVATLDQSAFKEAFEKLLKSIEE